MLDIINLVIAWLKKIRLWVEAINTYYAFALLLYGAGLFALRHSTIFILILVATLPVLAGWSGYLLRSYLDRRSQRHGFSVLSDSMSYEVRSRNKYTLRYVTRLKAATDHLMTYPVGYQWTGSGKHLAPRLNADKQYLLTAVRHTKNGEVRTVPYKSTVAGGDWHYNFVAFNPPVHRGDIVTVQYKQDFYDTKHHAKPMLYYFARLPMKRLELSVKFLPNALPRKVTCSYIKPSDPSRPYEQKGFYYDQNHGWVIWTIAKPKRGYCYRITWH